MSSRRRLLASTAALTAGSLLAPDRGAAADRTLALDLVLRRRGQRGYAVITGIDPRTGRWFFLGADGRTRVYPGSPTRPMTPLGRDVAIALPTNGTARRIRLPQMISGRIYLSVGRKLAFFVNPGGGIATPSVTNPSDANATVDWSFAEFTHDSHGLYANISFVDFVGLPVALDLDGAAGRQTVGGLRRDGLARIAAGLRAQTRKDAGRWSALVTRSAGRDLRILSPNLAAAAAGGRNPLASYLDADITRAWNHYRSRDLVIDTQSVWGVRRGRVGNDGRLRFAGAGSFSRPSTHAVFNCSVTPFSTANDLMGNLSARLAAALNRSTLMINSRHPDTSPTHFYAAARTNHYARLVHANTADGAGYAFPYDDVHSAGFNAEGRVVDARPRLFRVQIG